MGVDRPHNAQATFKRHPACMQALDWNAQGKRKVGRPRQTWRRSTEAEVKAAGMTWAELKRISQNRVRWRSAVPLCSRAEPEA
ncbi:hypothetical protein ACOMHN_063656 [Nucella lapillus]